MRLVFLFLFAVWMVSLPIRSAAVELEPGDLLSAAAVLNDTVISVLRVDPETGNRTVISGPSGSGSVIGSGPPIARNSGRDVGLTYFNGAIWASTSAGGKYIRIDPDSGDRTIVSGCPGFGNTICQDTLIGAGPDVSQTWALVAVPEDDLVTREEFSALVGDVETLAERVDDLEDSDETQSDEIQRLRADLALLQARVTTIEELPGIAKKLGQ